MCRLEECAGQYQSHMITSHILVIVVVFLTLVAANFDAGLFILAFV